MASKKSTKRQIRVAIEDWEALLCRVSELEYKTKLYDTIIEVLTELRLTLRELRAPGHAAFLERIRKDGGPHGPDSHG